MTDTGSDQRTVRTGRRTVWTDRCREALEDDREVHLRVHTRSAAPEFGTRDFHDAVVEGVRGLEEAGRVDAVEFDIWGKHVGTSRGENGDEWTAPTVGTYRAWADREGVELPFEHRECNSMLIEEAYSVLVPPHVLVAVLDGDGNVVGVAPCVDDGGPTSVMDLLTLLDGHDRPDERRASASA